MTEATSPTDALHTELKNRLRWLCSIFGQPSDLLRLLAVAEWRRLRTWVRGLEALAVQLVRALAAALPASAADAPLGAKQPPAVRTERSAPDTDYPDSAFWPGVQFRFPADEPSDARRPPARCAEPDATQWALSQRPDIGPDTVRGFRSARRLALRLEAVIRIAENAQRCARRYAARLARRAARPTPGTPHRIAQPPTPNAAHIAAAGPPLRPPIVESG